MNYEVPHLGSSVVDSYVVYILYSMCLYFLPVAVLMHVADDHKAIVDYNGLQSATCQTKLFFVDKIKIILCGHCD